MRRILAVTVLAIVASTSLVGCAAGGPLESEAREISDASAVVVSSSADVVITEGEPALTARGSRANLDRMTSEVRDGVLYLDTKPGLSLFAQGEMSYEVALPELEGVSIVGSGDVRSDFASSELTLSIDGSGGITIITDVELDSAEASIEGSGGITLEGAARSAVFSIEGSGDVRASELEARDIEASIGGSGSIGVWATDTLDASISGSGSIRYRGDAEVTSSIDGSGDIVAE